MHWQSTLALSVAILAGCASPAPEAEVARLRAENQCLAKKVVSLETELGGAREALLRERIRAGDAPEGPSARMEPMARLLDGPPVPAIDAQVTAVKDDVEPALVLLSVGSNAGVEKGFQFSVYRGSNFVGKVVVEKVLADSSGCRVLFTREGERILPGDLCATRLQ